MEQLKVLIRTLEREGPVVEGLTKENIRETKDVTAVILEHGTVKGQTVVMMVLKMDNGTFSIGQITATNFENLYALYKGAQQRFEDNKAAKN